MEIESQDINSTLDYVSLFSDKEISFPASVELTEKELFVLLSLFCRSEIIGLAIDENLRKEASIVVPAVRDNLIEKGMLMWVDHHLVLAPDLAVIISCISNANKTIVFNNDSLEAGGCSLAVYISNDNLYLTVFKAGKTFELRMDSNVKKMAHSLFTVHFQIDSYHDETFLEGITNALQNLPEEKNALQNGCDVELFFEFKCFKKGVPQSSATIYNLVQIEGLGSGLYKLVGSFLERDSALYHNQFEFYKNDTADLFAQAVEVICDDR